MLPAATPSPTSTPDALTWVDIGGFWVGVVGTAASTVIAVVAVVLSVSVARAQARRDARAKREAWAHQFSVWLDAGTVYMAAGIDAAILTDREWIDRGNDIQTRARLLESKGATDYMLEARKANDYIAKMAPEQRIRAAMFATKLLTFWAEGWVDDPRKQPGSIVEWLEHMPEQAAE